MRTHTRSRPCQYNITPFKLQALPSNGGPRPRPWHRAPLPTAPPAATMVATARVCTTPKSHRCSSDQPASLASCGTRSVAQPMPVGTFGDEGIRILRPVTHQICLYYLHTHARTGRVSKTPAAAAPRRSTITPVHCPRSFLTGARASGTPTSPLASSSLLLGAPKRIRSPYCAWCRYCVIARIACVPRAS